MPAMRDTMRTTGWLGALKTFFLLLFWPPGIAARRERIPWTLALGAHALGVVMAGLAVGLAAWIGNYPGRSLGDFLMEVASDVYAGFQQKSLPELLAIAGLTVVMLVSWEINALLTGLVVSPFGARDEKLRSSYWRGVKAAWLISPHVALTCGGLAVITAALSNTGAEGLLMRQPTAACIGLGSAALAVWFPAVLLLSVSTGKWGTMCRWPGVCRECGYQLAGVPMGAANCPECGLAIDESLRPAGAIGGPLERVEDGWWIVRWLRGVAGMVIAPRQFGQRLRLLSPQRRHLGATGAGIVTLQVASAAIEAAGDTSYRHGWGESILSGGTRGAIFVVLFVGGMVVAVWLIGSLTSLVHRRNLLAATAQTASYLMPLPAIWAMVIIVVSWCVAEWRILDGIHWGWLRANLSLEVSDLWPIAIVIVTVLLAGLILSSLFHVTWAARHNNE